MKDEIISLLQKKKSLSLKELMEALRIKNERQLKELGVCLNELEDERRIYNNHSAYCLVDNENYMTGRLRDVNNLEYCVSNKDKKVYIPKMDARIFMDKDEVLVRMRKNGNQIIHVYQRGITFIPGVFIRTSRGLKFRSDVDLHTSFDVVNLKDYQIPNGTKAVVKVVEYTAPLKVKIVELLGKENEPGVDVTAILVENQVRMDFGKKMKKELEDLPDKVRKKDLKGRVDLRDLQTVTIDGESTKDFDDAISVEKLDNGNYRLYVHIADVANYVPEGEEIDEEAYKRGTSIYVADRVVPMLPFALSNGICSLNPEVDRLTLTCAMDFTPEGVMVDYKIYESVIHSDCRCTYGKVNQFLDNEADVPEYAPIKNLLHNFSDLAKALKKKTGERGHIEFETKEPYYVLDEKGNPVDIVIRERGWSEQMIEEAMIAANVAVAHELDSKGLPGMYRIHEDPDPEKIETLNSMARALGVKCNLDPENVKPLDIANVLESIEDPDVKKILSTIAVRSMQKARYSHENTGHFGLALDEYCHFTSPIRRYPDLCIHRMLKKYVIGEQADDKKIAKDNKRMQKSALHLSEKERDAVTIERAVNDLESAKFMKNKVGQEFDGVVSGITNFGVFVELDNTVEGLAPLRNMDDFFIYDADTMSLKAENSPQEYRMGQPVRIRVKDVNVPKRQITFDLIESEAQTEPEVVPEELPAVESANA